MIQQGVDAGEHRVILGLHEIEEQCELVDCIWLPLFLLNGLLLEFFEVLVEWRIKGDEDLGI